MIRFRWAYAIAIVLSSIIVAGLALADVSCKGEGEAQPVRVEEPDSLMFGKVPIGLHRDLSFTITNEGGGILADSVRIDALCSLSYSIVSGAGPYALGADEQIEVVVRFAPSDVVGPEECTIKTTSGD